MKVRWLDSAGTYAVLAECEQILDGYALPGAGERKGHLVFVTGAPRAGASSVARQLAKSARWKGVHCLAVSEAPWGGNIYLRTHILHSLEVPMLDREFQSGDLASKPFETLLALRSYPAILIDNGHDYFIRHRYTAQQNLEKLIQLTADPRVVFVFGVSDILAPVAIAAQEKGAQVSQIYLPAMGHDQGYLNFVTEAFNCHHWGKAHLPTIDVGALHRLTKGSVGRTMDALLDIAFGSPWVSPLVVANEVSQGAGPVSCNASVKAIRPPKLFHGMLKPVDGETLSSWLSRNAASPHIPHVHSEFLDACSALAKTRTQNDLDLLYQHDEFLSLFPESDRPGLVRAFALPGDISSFETSLNYCPQCLLEDAKAMRAPVWRREWRRRGVCLCEAHGSLILLQELKIRSKEHFHRAWLAFSQHASTGTYVLGNHFIQRLTTLTDSSHKEQRLCNVVRRIRGWVEALLDFPTYGRPSKACVRFLMGFFLYRPFFQSKGGLGSWFLGAPGRGVISRDFRYPGVHELNLGIDTASPRDLALTYLLVGCAFDLLSDADITLIRGATYFTNAPFPENLDALRALARCFLNHHMNKFKQSARKNLAAGDMSHLDWLFV